MWDTVEICDSGVSRRFRLLLSHSVSFVSSLKMFPMESWEELGSLPWVHCLDPSFESILYHLIAQGSEMSLQEAVPGL